MKRKEEKYLESSHDAWDRAGRYLKQVDIKDITKEIVIDGEIYTFMKSTFNGNEPVAGVEQSTWDRIGGRPSNEEILAGTIVVDGTGARMSIDRKMGEVPEGFHLQCALNGRAK